MSRSPSMEREGERGRTLPRQNPQESPLLPSINVTTTIREELPTREPSVEGNTYDHLTRAIWKLFYASPPGNTSQRSDWLRMVQGSDVFLCDDAVVETLRWSWMHISTLVDEEPGLSGLLLGLGANSVEMIWNVDLDSILLGPTPSTRALFLTTLPLPCVLPFVRKVLMHSNYDSCALYTALGEEQHKVLVETCANSGLVTVCKNWGMLPGQREAQDLSYKEQKAPKTPRKESKPEQGDWDVEWTEDWGESADTSILEQENHLDTLFPPGPPALDENQPDAEQDEKSRIIWGEWTQEYGDARDAINGELYFDMVQSRMQRWAQAGLEHYKQPRQTHVRIIQLPQLSIAAIAPSSFASQHSASVFLLPSLAGFFPLLDYPTGEWTSYIQTGDLKLGDLSAVRQAEVLLSSCHVSNLLDSLSGPLQDHLHAIGDTSKLACRGLVQLSSHRIGAQRRAVTGNNRSVGVVLIDRTVDLIGGGLAHGEGKSAVDLIVEALALHGDTSVQLKDRQEKVDWWRQPCDVSNIPLDPLFTLQDSAIDLDSWTASLSTLSDAKLWNRLMDTGVPGNMFLTSTTSPITSKSMSPTRASVLSTTGSNTTQPPYIAGATFLRNLLADDALQKDDRGWTRPKALGRPNLGQLRKMLQAFSLGKAEDRNHHLDAVYDETTLLTLVLALTTAMTRCVEPEATEESPKATHLRGARWEELTASEKVLSLIASQGLFKPLESDWNDAWDEQELQSWPTPEDARKVREQIIEHIKTILPDKENNGATMEQALRILTYALSLHPKLLLPNYDPEDSNTFAEEEEDEMDRMKLVEALVKSGMVEGDKNWKQHRQQLESWAERALLRLRRIAIWKMDGGMGKRYRSLLLPGPPPLNAPFLSQYLTDVFATLDQPPPRTRSVSPHRESSGLKKFTGFTSSLLAASSATVTGSGEYRLGDGVATHVSYGVSLRALGGLAKSVGSTVAKGLEGVVREGIDSAGTALERRSSGLETRPSQSSSAEKKSGFGGWGSLLGSVASTVTSTTRSLGNQLAQGLSGEQGQTNQPTTHPLTQYPVLLILVLGGITASEAAAVREVVRRASEKTPVPEVLIGGTGWSIGNSDRGGLTRAIWGDVQ